MAWQFERLDVPSDGMAASHVNWFNSQSDDIQRATAQGLWVGKEAEESFLCIELIQTAYASAKDGSRELPRGRQVTETLPEQRKLRQRACPPSSTTPRGCTASASEAGRST